MGRDVAEDQWNGQMNLRVLKRTRRIPVAGDVFVMLPMDGLYVYGRVIRTDAMKSEDFNGNLIYIYRGFSKEKTAIPVLDRESLLVPPIITNRLPWSAGYLEYLENRPLTAADVLEQHCFHDFRGFYCDEYGARLAAASPPIGEWGLASYRTIDDEVSKALGLPIAEED